ncbi:hypothetical protein L3X38_042654 [Prunus dulcis]|uniref:Uncharacterized protein n=1 Tax=Prunus dulcis TaxID=3755 RepID=A0AAD4YM64_PRUDU|nr:hypothetical protein L3X38_042654 [Prunus dulcis]
MHHSPPVADLCRRKEVHLNLQPPEKSIRAAGIAPLLQTTDARNVLDEMPKPPGHCTAAAAGKKLQVLLFFSFNFR